MTEQKAGHKTSEFWLTCGAAITAFAASLSTDDKDKSIAYGIIAAVVVLKYLYGRYQLKMAAQANQNDTNNDDAPKSAPPLALALAAMFLLCLASDADARPWRVYVAPRPIVVLPILPSVPLVRVVVIDPNKPAYPGLPVYIQQGNPPVYYQLVTLP